MSAHDSGQRKGLAGVRVKTACKTFKRREGLAAARRATYVLAHVLHGKVSRRCFGPCKTVFEKSKQKPIVLHSSGSSSILHFKTYLLYMITAYGTVSFCFITFSCNHRVVVLKIQTMKLLYITITCLWSVKWGSGRGIQA